MGVALELEQKFPLRELGEERLEAVRVAQGSELPAGDFIREREIVPAEHVHMLVQQRGQPRHVLVVHRRSRLPQVAQRHPDIPRVPVMLQGFLPKMPKPLGGSGKLEELYGKAAQNLVARGQGGNRPGRSQWREVHRRTGPSAWGRWVLAT